MATGVQPDQYLALTVAERNAFIDIANRRR